MTPAFRSTALAAALATMSYGAMAEKINFESFWDSTIKNTDQPKSVGKSDVKGFVFAEGTVWAYKKEMLKPGVNINDDVLPTFWDLPGTCTTPSGTTSADREALCNTTGFIMNRPRGSSGRVVDVSLDPALYGSRYITNITLDLFHNAPSGSISAIAGSESRVLNGFTSGDTKWIIGWKADLSNLPFQATTLRFDFGQNALALDNLNFTLSGSSGGGGGGTAPEPASYALVGLALLAAGAARRRNA
ncbi:MAG: PEP-CTERM sorting domain-containing protein [Aquabacterium sp.]|nr:PEP-CTERM sorting domain-containing protein [Aquabacterium sp.]